MHAPYSLTGVNDSEPTAFPFVEGLLPLALPSPRAFVEWVDAFSTLCAPSHGAANGLRVGSRSGWQ